MEMEVAVTGDDGGWEVRRERRQKKSNYYSQNRFH